MLDTDWIPQEPGMPIACDHVGQWDYFRVPKTCRVCANCKAVQVLKVQAKEASA